MAVRLDAAADTLTRTVNLPTVTAFTMMGWFRIVVDRNDYSGFLHRGDTFGHALIVITGADGLRLEYYDSDAVGGLVGTTLVLGTWYHIAFTRSGDTRTVYLNGVVDMQDTTGTPTVTDTQMTFGNSFDSEFLNGRAAAIKVYDAVLTATEILAESRQYAPVRWANLNGWYPLLDTATDQDDFSGNGNALTVGGTLATEEGPPIPWQRYKNRRGSSAEAAQGWGHLLGSSRNRLVYVSR